MQQQRHRTHNATTNVYDSGHPCDCKRLVGPTPESLPGFQQCSIYQMRSYHAECRMNISVRSHSFWHTLQMEDVNIASLVHLIQLAAVNLWHQEFSLTTGLKHMFCLPVPPMRYVNVCEGWCSCYKGFDKVWYGSFNIHHVCRHSSILEQLFWWERVKHQHEHDVCTRIDKQQTGKFSIWNRFSVSCWACAHGSIFKQISQWGNGAHHKRLWHQRVPPDQPASHPTCAP